MIAAKQNPLHTGRVQHGVAPNYPTAFLFLRGLPAEVGMEADDESEPNSGDVLGSGGVPPTPCS